MENRNIKKQISPDEIDAKIHQRILIEERFLKWNIGVAAAFTLLFLAVFVIAIFKQNLKGIITVIITFADIGYISDYRKIKKRKYPCYLWKIEEFVDDQYLRVNSDVKAVYSKEDFKGIYVYSEEGEDEEESQDAGKSPQNIEAVLINSVDDHWYAFSMK